MSGVVIDRWGAEWLWGLCAVIGTVAGVGYWALMRRMPEEKAAAEKPVEKAAAEKPVEETVREPSRRPSGSPS